MSGRVMPGFTITDKKLVDGDIRARVWFNDTIFMNVKAKPDDFSEAVSIAIDKLKKLRTLEKEIGEHFDKIK